MRNASRTSTALAAAVALALLARPAAADSEAAPPVHHGPHLSAAIRLYDKLDLDAAMAELRLAEDEARNSESETVTTLIYEGLIFAENGKNEETMDHFKRALATSPWAEVPPGTAPRLSRQFNDARKELWGSGGLRPPPKKQHQAVQTAPVPPAKTGSSGLQPPQ